MDDKEVFDQFCQQVGLDEECGEKSWNVWESVSKKVSQTTKDTLIPWFVCATSVTICNKRYAADQAGENIVTPHSVSDLLKVAKMRMVEFFQEMKEFVEIYDVGNSVTESLTELKKTFCISSAIFYKFKRLMPVVLKDDQAFSTGSEKAKDSFWKTCWFLFIVCKGWQPHQLGDLMTTFYLLLCCVDYVHRRFLSQQPTALSETKNNLEEGILPDLCKEANVQFSMVDTFHTQYFQPFLDSKSERNLLEMDELNSMYEEICGKCRDLDERDFFDKHGHLWISPSETDSNGTCNGGPTSTSVQESHTISATTESRGPYPSPVADLRTALDEMSDAPSQELLRFWACCKKDPQELIQSQLTAVQENFVKGFAEAVCEDNSDISNQVFVEAKRLYLRVMEAMLLAVSSHILLFTESSIKLVNKN